MVNVYDLLFEFRISDERIDWNFSKLDLMLFEAVV